MSSGGFRHKRAVLAALIAAATALVFWSQSRIPQLNEKAMMGDRSDVAGIAFGSLLPADATLSLPVRIVHTAVNWGNTNWKGMTFGLLFAGAFLTLLTFIPRGKSENPVFNTFKGLVAGAPLGLCVNCATPVARGMTEGGLKPETALSALLSSPTLNPIVLTMLFAMFPLHFALTKLGLTLVMVLLVVPVVCALLLRSSSRARPEEVQQSLVSGQQATGWFFRRREIPESEIPSAEMTGGESWLRALGATLEALLRSLWFIVKATVPLMLLAGVLGAVLIELVPFDVFQDVQVAIPGFLLLALVGSFLPVPIAFDVIMVSVLIATGLPLPFAMTLLFTLGIFSIYPFMVIWRSISPAVATSLFLVVMTLGVGAGEFMDWYEARNRSIALSIFEESLLGRVERQSWFTIERMCEEPAAGTRDECKMDAASRLQAVAPDPEICQRLEVAEQRAACLDEYAFSVANAKAVATQDPNACGVLEGVDEAVRCKDAAINEIAINDVNLQLELCESWREPLLITQCRADTLRKWVTTKGDPTWCSYLDRPGERESCELYARVDRYARDRDVDGCASLSGASQRYCFEQIVSQQIEDGSAAPDPGLCRSYGRPQIVGPCLAKWVKRRLEYDPDPAHCDQLPSADQLDDCRREAHARRVVNEISRVSAMALGLAEERETPDGQPVPAPPPASALAWTPVHAQGDVSIRASALRPRNPMGERPFSRFEGPELGVDRAARCSALEFREPFMTGRGLGAGDLNGDGWPDLALASERGVLLYQNTGDGRFARLPAQIPELDALNVFNVALVDLDDDGRLDLYATPYAADNLVVYNDGQGFRSPRVQPIPRGERILTHAAAVGDLDRDGRLDLVEGNWSYGSTKSFIPEFSRNRVLYNREGGFEAEGLPEVPGETLSVLVSDVDADGWPDLFVGNDHRHPDAYYFGGPEGLEPVGPEQGVFPATPVHTMGIDSADVNNDGHLDLLATDMSFGPEEVDDYCAAISNEAERRRCSEVVALWPHVRDRDMQGCLVDANGNRTTCMLGVMAEIAAGTRDPAICGRFPAAFTPYAQWCRTLTRSVPDIPFRLADNLKQEAENKLLIGTGERRWIDRSAEAGIDKSFWSWNVRAGDLDNDGWQDVYVGNGVAFDSIHSNVLFRNRDGGTRFERAEKAFGLVEYLNTPAFLYLDYDNDGDLDVIGATVNGPVVIFRNNEDQRHALVIGVRDFAGNRFGIGTRLTLHYQGPDGPMRQVREIKAGGGFESFDAPLAHFGLGAAEAADALEITWSTGETTRLDVRLAADRRYLVSRGGSPGA